MSSRVFDARTGTGECYFCRANFATGERVCYLTAKALRDTPERPLTPREERAAAQHGRAVRAARAARTAVPTAPAWLWERLVHAACARRAGFPVSGAETEARVGTRTVGHSHGVGLATATVTATVTGGTAGGTPVAIPAPVAPTPVDAGFAAAIATGATVAPAIDTTALPTGNRAYVEAVRDNPENVAARAQALAARAQALAERNRAARGETVAPVAPVTGGRGAFLDLDPRAGAPVAPVAPVNPEPVAYARKLDLD